MIVTCTGKQANWQFQLFSTLWYWYASKYCTYSEISQERTNGEFQYLHHNVQQQQQYIYLKKYKFYNTLCPANSYNANLGRTRL